MIKTILAAIVGGFLAFGWSSVSWMALPFHAKTLTSFSNEPAVAETIMAGANGRGVYLIPGDQTMEFEAKMETMKKGPFVFAVVRPGANEGLSMGTSMLRGLTASLVAGLLLALLLAAAAPRLNYAGRVGFVFLVALIVAIVGLYPNNIWWKFPPAFVLANMADIVVGWTIGGLAMAGLVNGR